MTTDTQSAPTDAEIWQMWMPMVRRMGVADPVEFARAVLAKWSTPQPTSAEFALQALVAAGHVSQELVDKALSLPGASQPVVREPMTDGQLLLLRFATSSLFHLFERGNKKEIPHYQLMDEMGKVIEHVIRCTVAAHAQAGAVPLEICEWSHEESDGFWESSCGDAWRFDDGGPKENNMHFCHHCGKPLRIKGGQHGPI